MYPLPCPTVTLAFLAPSSHSCLAGDLEVLHWWYGHLGDDERIFMFSTLYDYIGRSPSSESGKQLRTSWSLCGVTICRLGFRKVLGIGSTKLVKMIHGIPDRRRTNTIRNCPQRDRVNAFFLEIYMSAAEPLPHERYLAKGVATV